jgi:hypothetical protein
MRQIERTRTTVEQPADIGDARLRSLYELWAAKCGGRRMPARADFVPEEFKAWMPHVALYEVEGDAASFRLKVRLSGTEMVRLDGADLTGRYFDEAIDTVQHAAIYESYRQCIELAAPRYESAEIEPFDPVYAVAPVPFRYFRKLLLPLSTGGLRVEMMLVSIYADFDPTVDGERLSLREASRRSGLDHR